jgi:hypothetical protein
MSLQKVIVIVFVQGSIIESTTLIDYVIFSINF